MSKEFITFQEQYGVDDMILSMQTKKASEKEKKKKKKKKKNNQNGIHLTKKSRKSLILIRSISEL